LTCFIGPLFDRLALDNPHILHECHAINGMLKFIVNFEHEELLESVLYALLNAVDRFTVNDNSEPTIIDSVDSNGPAWILVDEGMRDRHELIRHIFSVSCRPVVGRTCSLNLSLSSKSWPFSLCARKAPRKAAIDAA
jgi:hypothetical protein